MKSAFSSQLSAVSTLLMLTTMLSPVVANPFADAVVPGSYLPGPGQFVHSPLFNDPSRCLGAPHGLYVDEPDNSSLVTLGDGGKVTLSFNDPVYDDPKNPYGLDFIVFSNAMFIGPFDPYHRWQELAFVEISQNGTDWYLIEPSILPADMVGGTDTGQSYTIVSGYAEYTPTVGLPQELIMPAFAATRTAEELYTLPERPSVVDDDGTIWFDYVSGGGDALDIARAVVQTSPGVPSLDGEGHTIPANLPWFRYVRITDAKTGDSMLGSEISAEIDAVADVRPALSIGEAKRLPECGYAVIAGAIVTAMFPYEFVIESPDRSAAIKVSTDQYVLPGDIVTVTGRVHKAGGAFVLDDVMFTTTAGDADLPKPMGMSIATLAGDMTYGLRVRTWGTVTDEGDGSYIVISDGASSAKVSCPAGVSCDEGEFVIVTGICDREGGSPSTVVRVIDSNDVQPIAQ